MRKLFQHGISPCGEQSGRFPALPPGSRGGRRLCVRATLCGDAVVHVAGAPSDVCGRCSGLSAEELFSLVVGALKGLLDFLTAKGLPFLFLSHVDKEGNASLPQKCGCSGECNSFLNLKLNLLNATDPDLVRVLNCLTGSCPVPRSRQPLPEFKTLHQIRVRHRHGTQPLG